MPIVNRRASTPEPIANAEDDTTVYVTTCVPYRALGVDEFIPGLSPRSRASVRFSVGKDSPRVHRGSRSLQLDEMIWNEMNAR